MELAAEVLTVGIALNRITNPKHILLGTLCDNTPTVSWIDKMASKSKSPTAGRLLHGLAFMLDCVHAGRLTTVHVPDVDNVMANIALLNHHFLTLIFALPLTPRSHCLTTRRGHWHRSTMVDIQRLRDAA